MSNKSQEEKLPFVIAPGDLTDQKLWNFVTSSLWQSLGQSCDYLGMPRQTFIYVVNHTLSNAKPNLRCKVAVDPEDSDQWFGHAIAKGDSLIYVYTKASFRAQGVATELCKSLDIGISPDKVISCPLSTPVGLKLAAHRGYSVSQTDFWFRSK